MDDLSGKFFVDGRDAWNVYNIVYESGADDFLKYPAAKDRITHDWADANGTDVDTSIVTFKSREITLKLSMWIQTGLEDDFRKSYEGFIALWAKPGLHRVQFHDLGLRSFYCIYKETPTNKRVTNIRGREGKGIFFTFTFRLLETEPVIENLDEFIVDEDGNFIVT